MAGRPVTCRDRWGKAGAQPSSRRALAFDTGSLVVNSPVPNGATSRASHSGSDRGGGASASQASSAV